MERRWRLLGLGKKTKSSFYAVNSSAFWLFRAIFRRSSGDKFSILALADLRPIWAKYAESFLSITAASYHAQPMSMKSATTAVSPRC
jgi:hypothetical protein